jgi:hypothetical protein
MAASSAWGAIPHSASDTEVAQPGSSELFVFLTWRGRRWRRIAVVSSATHPLARTRAATCSATFVAAQPQPSSVPLPASHMRCNPTK